MGLNLWKLFLKYVLAKNKLNESKCHRTQMQHTKHMKWNLDILG
jgi:hypothetical protein